MGNRQRKTCVHVTNSPANVNDIPMVVSTGKGLTARDRKVQAAILRANRKAQIAFEVEADKLSVGNRVMKAAIRKVERNDKPHVPFMAQSEISRLTNAFNGNVKLVSDKDGIHFSGHKKRKANVIVDVNAHGTESKPFVFRDNVSGRVMGKSVISTNKRW